MKGVFISFFVFVCCAGVSAQADMQPLFEVEKAFGQAVSEKGTKSAFLEYLSDDAIIFQPDALNGKEFWKAREDYSSNVFVRTLTYADIASNGLLGYTTGNWRRYQKGKSESLAEFGQYVTVWEKRPDGKFRATLDISTKHEKLPFYETDRVGLNGQSRDANKRGWAPADASMNFLRMSMSREALGGAYEKFAGKDVRLLLDGKPPILGKKNVVSEMKHYISIAFPAKVAMFQSADMAYIWNPCEFANSNEGLEEGNCLHIWKLRDDEWRIVLGVFAEVPNMTKPKLKERPRAKKRSSKE